MQITHKFNIGDNVKIYYRNKLRKGEVGGIHVFVGPGRVALQYMVHVMEWDMEMRAYDNVDSKWYNEEEIQSGNLL